jgi:photosystem II stability/assembly factor-like uncharacterized protein
VKLPLWAVFNNEGLADWSKLIRQSRRCILEFGFHAVTVCTIVQLYCEIQTSSDCCPFPPQHHLGQSWELYYSEITYECRVHADFSGKDGHPSMTSHRLAVSILLYFFLFTAAEGQWWKVQTSGLDTNLRGVSAVYTPDKKSVAAVWAVGSNGVVLRSLDLGKEWKRLHVSGGDGLDFRGIVAFDAKTAYVMSIGKAGQSRIYKTSDGGESWKLQYSDSRPEFFLDAIACTSEKQCLAVGDSLDSKFLMLETTDGEHWSQLPAEHLPSPRPGEGSFAASNSNISLSGSEIFVVTGVMTARVLHSADSGHSWTVMEAPIVHGNESSGIFSIARMETDAGPVLVVVGGDYRDVKRASAVAATSLDRGKAWRLAAQQPGGFRSAVAALDKTTFIAVGPTGEDISVDQGAHWKPIGSLNLNAVTILDDQYGWAVGPNGTVARFVNHRER